MTSELAETLDMVMSSQNVLYEEDFQRLEDACDMLYRDANGKAVFLVGRSGQVIAKGGETAAIDSMSLASLAAGNMAATGGLARLIGEKEFPNLFHEGERESIHISLVGSHWIVVVIFDQRSSLGLVRLRVRKAAEVLNQLAKDIEAKGALGKKDSPFVDISDEEIDNLFADL